MKIGVVSREITLQHRAGFAQGLRFVRLKVGLEEITAADFVGAQVGQTVLLLTGQAAAGCCQGGCIDAAVIGTVADYLP